MCDTISEVMEFVEENDVKFIRLAFCDIFGNIKNIAVQSEELSRIFEYGVSFDASAVRGFMNVEESDLFLFPDLSTLAVLPWRPQQGRVIRFYCDIRHPDGHSFVGDGRYLLKTAVKKAKEMGYSCQIGAECEFYLFEQDENGKPTKIPHDNAEYMDVAPLDKGENVRREICLILEEMGVKPESSHHETGPGQNEIDFRYSSALKAADNLITFKSVVRTVASMNGLHASFMPKPIRDKSGNGLHINMSLFKEGENIFQTAEDIHSEEAESFIAGILKYAKELTVFTNPLTNSYQRLGSFEAPAYVTWSHQNRSQLVRIPATTEQRKARMELRSPDPSCNPYFVYALLIFAGLAGVEEKLSLPAPTNLNLYELTDTKEAGINSLPENLMDAVHCAAESAFLQRVLPERIFHTFLEEKTRQWKAYNESVNHELFEAEHYFNVV